MDESVRSEGISPGGIALYEALCEKAHRYPDKNYGGSSARRYEDNRLLALARCASGEREKVAAIVKGGMIASADSSGFVDGFNEYENSPTLRSLLDYEAERYL